VLFYDLFEIGETHKRHNSESIFQEWRIAVNEILLRIFILSFISRKAFLILNGSEAKTLKIA